MVRHDIGAVILAAGLGTRMKSGKAKVLHQVCGKPMISYVLDTAVKISPTDHIVVVVGHQAEEVRKTCLETAEVRFALQARQLGTGHAVQCALPYLAADVAHVVILCGDIPLLQPDTVSALIDDHIEKGRALSLLAVEVDSPRGYGRVIMDSRRNLTKIVEEKDATAKEKRIKLINAGIYCVERRFLHDAIRKITPDNAQNELYLTDIIEIGYLENERIGVLVGRDGNEVMGVNTPQDLKTVASLLQDSLPVGTPSTPGADYEKS